MAGIANIINELSTKEHNGIISTSNSKIAKQFVHLLIREEFIKVQKVSNNKYRIKELMLNNVVLVNRKPLKTKHIIGFASEVLPTITGADQIGSSQQPKLLFYKIDSIKPSKYQKWT